MKTLKVIVLGILAFIGCLYVIYPFGAWNYRMTINVETPEGIKTGSVVREVYVATGPDLLPQAHSYVRVKGEAVVIDLGPRGLLFAIMRNDTLGVDYGKNVFLSMFGKHGYNGSTTPTGVWHLNVLSLLKSGTTKQLEPDYFPILVRFRDINDPKSVERVDPNNLAATFGEGVKLLGATIEITDEPITTGIEKVLPSWKDTDFAKWRASLPYGHPLAIDRSDFIKGASK